MANVRTRPVGDDRHFITCHSRESGNPERASADPTLDSRFRGNDKGGGWPLTAPKRSLAFTVSCTGACRRADIRRSSTAPFRIRPCRRADRKRRSEEHTSELQSLMRTSYAVFCLTKKKQQST